MYRILNQFIFVLFFSSLGLWAGNDIGCPNVNQAFAIGKQWQCPTNVGNNLEATLSDLDVESGKYTCEYRQPDTYKVVTVCSYIATTYKQKLDAKLEEVKKLVVGKIKTGSGNTISFSPGFHQATIGDNIDTRFTGTPEYDHEIGLIDRLSGEITTELASLHTHYNESVDSTISDGYLSKLNPTATNHPLVQLKKSYNSFVKPYTPKGGTSRKPEDTFSKFIIGLVTLNSTVVKGYAESNGTLLLKKSGDSFKVSQDRSDGLIKAIIKSAGVDLNNTILLNTDKQSISGWLQLFTQKVWGFYYNLQRRLDLGYDKIATQLLFLMMVFFSIGMAVKGGTRYITNRENGHSSGEIKINEASIMKTLGILAAVFTFYISVPTNSSSDYDPRYNNSSEQSDLESNEMRGNNSLSKYIIRYAMMEGSKFGTMISDLGTDAFLQYIYHKQGLNNGLNEADNVIKSIMSMVYYFPAYEIVNECRYQTGLTDAEMLSNRGSVAVSPEFAKDMNLKNNPHQKSPSYFYRDNKIKSISDELCRKMIARTSEKLHDVAFDIKSLMKMIENDKYLRMEATSSLIGNHIALQKELGWMNIASIPYTYFMMKHQNLFYESTVDFNDIENNVSDYVNNMGLRGAQESMNSTLWMKDKAETSKRLKLDDDGDLVKEYTRLAVYNFLPGFTNIRNEVLQRMQSLFSDILRMQRAEQGSYSESKKSFSDMLGKLVSAASKYYGRIDNLYDITKLKSSITDALRDNDAIKLHKLFYKISYLVAMGIWKSGFILVFLSAIAMIIGVNIVLYVINVMVHFFISPFIVIWAFSTSPDGGATKIKNYLRDTVIYMLYPTIIVVGVFMFIFAYELFYNIYGFITSMLIEGQTKVVENAVIAANASNYTKEGGTMSFLAIYALRDITEILIDVLSVYVAFLTINKFPELVLKMMGVGDSAVIMLPQASEAIQSKGGGSVNPLSR